MYILGIDRHNLLRYSPTYTVMLANSLDGSYLFTSTNIKRQQLQKIVNLPLIDELGVWSDDEFNLIANLCARPIIIIRDWLMKKENIKRNKTEEITIEFILKWKVRYQSGDKSNQLPPVEIVKNEKGEPSLDLTYMKYEIDGMIKALN